MIVDVHTHTPVCVEPVPPDAVRWDRSLRPDRTVKMTVGWDEYMAAMAPVDRAIVFAVAMQPGDRPNEATAALVRAHPDKLLGFLSVHPHDPQALEEIEHGVGDLGLRGIKLLPSYQGFDPLGEEARRIYRRADELHLPILFHTGTTDVAGVPLEWGQPCCFDHIAMAFPGLRMVLAHMAEGWDTVALLAALKKHPHVYADVSALCCRPWSFYNLLRQAEEWQALDRLLLGSDYPVTTPAETMAALRHPNAAIEGTSLPRISEVAMEEIIHRNALGLLGLA